MSTGPWIGMNREGMQDVARTAVRLIAIDMTERWPISGAWGEMDEVQQRDARRKWEQAIVSALAEVAP